MKVLFMRSLVQKMVAYTYQKGQTTFAQRVGNIRRSILGPLHSAKTYLP